MINKVLYTSHINQTIFNPTAHKFNQDSLPFTITYNQISFYFLHIQYNLPTKEV